MALLTAELIEKENVAVRVARLQRLKQKKITVNGNVNAPQVFKVLNLLSLTECPGIEPLYAFFHCTFCVQGKFWLVLLYAFSSLYSVRNPIISVADDFERRFFFFGGSRQLPRVLK